MIATEEKRRGSYPAPVIDTLTKSYSTIPFLRFQSWWREAERLALLFRRTNEERHLVALARHLDAAYARLTERSAS
jgi:hypothetical protein